MKKVIYIAIVTTVVALVSCGMKTECDFCGEEKACKEKTILGETMYVCNDCLDEISE